jgi:small subunit ribosomal protein S6
MRSYELVVVVHPDLDENAFKGMIDKIQSWIRDAGGAIDKVDTWGKRRLAYPIRKQREGQYVLFQTQMTPAFTTELERNLRLTEPVMRFLITAID